MMRAEIAVACLSCATICSCSLTTPKEPFLASWFMTESAVRESASTTEPRFRSDIYVAIMNRSDRDQQISAIVLNPTSTGSKRTGYWWKHLEKGPFESGTCTSAKPQVLKPGGVFFRRAIEFEDAGRMFPDCTVPVNVIVYRDTANGGCEPIPMSSVGLPSSAPHDWAENGCPAVPPMNPSPQSR